jgi:RNA polymerase sigma-70 factor (ECF subfamily)
VDLSSFLSLPQDSRYRAAIEIYGRDVARFAAGYERDPVRREDLLQEVHIALWQSLAGFQGQCSLRTWVYRVAHNACVTHIQKSLRSHDQRALSLDDIADCADEAAAIDFTDRRLDLQRVIALVRSLGVIDRQVMLLYLEDLDASAIAEVTGLSAGNVATKIHRLKALLAKRLNDARYTDD